MDPWDEVIQRITPDLEAGEAELRSLMQQVGRVTQRVEGLRFAMRYAREAKADALTQQTGPAESTPAPQVTAPGSPDIAVISPTKLAEAVVDAAEGDLKTQVIRQRMSAMAGREITNDQVKGALAYLKRKGRIEHVGPALWRARRSSAPSQDLTPTAGAAGVSQSGENGWSGRPDVLTRAGA